MRSIQLAILILASTHLAAQCGIPIPAGATPLHGNDTTISTSEEFFWVCEGITATFTGENSIILGEAASYLHIFGDNNTVITKGGVMLHGMNTNVYALDADLVDDMGTNSDVAICSEITFQLEQAPPGGCMTTSIHEGSTMDVVSVFPNPMSDVLQVGTGDAHLIEVRVIDAMGREAIRHTGPQRMLDVRELPAGSYTVIIATTTNTYSLRAMKTARIDQH